MATKKIDPRLGKQINGVGPICPICEHYLVSEPRGMFHDLIWVYACKNCGVSYERRKP